MTECARRAYAEVESKMVVGQEYGGRFMLNHMSQYMIDRYIEESNIERERRVNRIYVSDIDDIYDPLFEEVPDGEDEKGEYYESEYYIYRLRT